MQVTSHMPAQPSNNKIISISEPERDGAPEGALVTGADYRGLGVIRSLGRRGIPVWVLNHAGHLVGAISRYASRTMKWPLEDDRKQLDFLVDLADRGGLRGWLLIPTDDEDVVLFARHHDLLSQYYRVTTPPWKTVRWLCDKRSLNQLAQAVSVDRPWTFCPRSRAELALHDCPFPVILKPAMRLTFNRLTADKAWRFEDLESLLKGYDEACELIDPELLMIQEVIPGGGDAQLSFAALCKDGTPLASLVARRTRQFPMDFGRFSTYVETIDEPQVVESAQRLLAPTQLTGIVEIEFKRDVRTGQLKLLDVNPRVWGWHTLSKRAGVDFPYLLWRLFTGRSVAEQRGRVGERWMRMCTDIPVAIQEIMYGRLSFTNYLKTLLGPKESAIFAWDDPLPGVLELPLLAAMMSRRFLTGKGI
jgi:D-aspartate ligase